MVLFTDPLPGGSGGRGVLELLQDQFLLAVAAELVGAEKVAIVERRQAVDVDLPRLEDGEDNPSASNKKRPGLQTLKLLIQLRFC